MRFLFVVTCAVALHFVSSFVLNEDLIRSKRSPDNETFSLKKVKDGVVTFGNKVSGAAVHGYEELKNLFSSKRKVGDYNIDKLDVRFGEEETTTVEEETATVAEDETITENQNEVRKKRAANEMSHDFTVDLDELAKHIRVLDTTKKPDRNKARPENIAETQPGLPKAEKKVIAPLICPENSKLYKGQCRMLLETHLK